MQNSQKQLHSQFLLRINEIQRRKEYLTQSIESKEASIKKEKLFQEKLLQVIQKREKNIQKLKNDQEELDKQIEFFQSYLGALNKNISSFRNRLDHKIRKKICVKPQKHNKFIQFKKQDIVNLTQAKLMGVKCNFRPQVLRKSPQISITHTEKGLSIQKITNTPFYCYLYNHYPLPTKGSYHFSMQIQCGSNPHLLIGVSSCKNTTQNDHKHLYFNFQKKQTQFNGQLIQKFDNQFHNKRKLVFLINPEKLYFFIVLDGDAICHADLIQFQDQYLFLFIAFSSPQTIIKIDNSRK